MESDFHIQLDLFGKPLALPPPERAAVLAANAPSPELCARVSQLLANDLQALTEQQASYEQAKHRALDLLKKKFRMGGKRVQDRDALHDRAVLR